MTEGTQLLAPASSPARNLAQSLRAPAVLRQGLAGGVGGLLVFLVLEAGYAGSGWNNESLFGASEGAFLPYLGYAGSLFFPGMVFAALVTALLVLADDLSTGHRATAAARALAGAIAGMVLGAGYSVIAHAVFAALWAGAEASGWPLRMLMARAVAWACFGLGVGLTAGIASRSMKRAYQGCAGGLAGGFLGGLLFALMQQWTGHGAVSRVIGFVALGALVGIATALVEQLSRTVWITFLSGSREGRQVSFYRDEIALGKDELADVPLFGDPVVEQRAALISLLPAPMILETALRPLLQVNGMPVQRAALTDGDLIQIGAHRFRFHCRAGEGPIPAAPAPQGYSPPAWGSTEPYAESTLMPEANTAPAAPAYRPDMVIALRVVAGAAKDVSVRLRDLGITIGRDMGNGLPLSDRKISRFHARIERIDGCWVLQDLGSTNGTRLNGLTVTRAGLVPGDYVYMGDTVLAVEELHD